MSSLVFLRTGCIRGRGRRGGNGKGFVHSVNGGMNYTSVFVGHPRTPGLCPGRSQEVRRVCGSVPCRHCVYWPRVPCQGSTTKSGPVRMKVVSPVEGGSVSGPPPSPQRSDPTFFQCGTTRDGEFFR